MATSAIPRPPPSPPSPPSLPGPYEYGKKRVWQGHKWSPWQKLLVADGEMATIDLRRGGRIGYARRPSFFDEERRLAMREAMLSCSSYRQYSFKTQAGPVGEPRTHVLLSAFPGTGYRYHGIEMKAEDLSNVDGMQELVTIFQRQYGVVFNIGADVLVYRTANDSCGWHADDTQGETKVVCVIVESQTKPRPVKFRPRRKMGRVVLSLGDEELALYPCAGDVYDFDGMSSLGYEHCVPKGKDEEEVKESRRMCIIMRAGREELVQTDSGSLLGSFLNPVGPGIPGLMKAAPAGFGHVLGVEELSLYKRLFLREKGAHSLDRRGISGSMGRGCDAVISSRTDSSQGEVDFLFWCCYTSSKRQGAGALFKSYVDRLPVRLFRSSNLGVSFAPVSPRGMGVQYRYDGLYRVVGAYNEAGERRKDMNALGSLTVGMEPLTTFRLVRCQASNHVSDLQLQSQLAIDADSQVSTVIKCSDGQYIRETCALCLDLMCDSIQSTKGVAVNLSVRLGKVLKVSSDTVPYAAQMARESASGKETWVQCTRCMKWRHLHSNGLCFSGLKSSTWVCSMNPDEGMRSCAIDEEYWSDDSAEWMGDWRPGAPEEGLTVPDLFFEGMYPTVAKSLGFMLQGHCEDYTRPARSRVAGLARGCESERLGVEGGVRKRRTLKHPFGDALSPCSACSAQKQGGLKCRVFRKHRGDNWIPPEGFDVWVKSWHMDAISYKPPSRKSKGIRHQRQGEGMIQDRAVRKRHKPSPRASEFVYDDSADDNEEDTLEENIAPRSSSLSASAIPSGFEPLPSLPKIGPELVGKTIMLKFNLADLLRGWHAVKIVKYMARPVGKKSQFNVDVLLPACLTKKKGCTVRARLTTENHSLKSSAAPGSWFEIHRAEA